MLEDGGMLKEGGTPGLGAMKGMTGVGGGFGLLAVTWGG